MIPRIHVVGGGVAGLTLAALLDVGRFDVTLYEPRPEPPAIRTGLGMWPGALAALDRASLATGGTLGNRVRRLGHHVDGGSLCDASGTPLLSAPANLVMIARDDLQRALTAAIPDGVKRVTASVADPTSLRGELVVGADGVHSTVRRTTFGRGTASRPTEWLVVRGVSEVETTGTTEYWGHGALLGRLTLGPGLTYWYTATRSMLGPRTVEVPQALAEVTPTLDQFGEAAAFIGEVDPAHVLAQRVWLGPTLRRYARGTTVLVGDAAHAMTPNLGRGACESILDAARLASELNDAMSSAEGITRAVRRYQVARYAPSQAARAASSALMHAVLTEGSTAATRDRILGVAGRGVRLLDSVSGRRGRG